MATQVNASQWDSALGSGIDSTDWMSSLDGNISLADLTMPGTHDSAARYNIGGGNSLDKDTLLGALAQQLPVVINGIYEVFTKNAPNNGPLSIKNAVYEVEKASWSRINPVSHAVRNIIHDDVMPKLDKYIGKMASEKDKAISYLEEAPLAAAQELTVKEQLDAGVRLLDFRGRQMGTDLEIYHGAIPQNKSVEEGLKEVKDFLSENDQESVIVYIQQERGNGVNVPLPTLPLIGDKSLAQLLNGDFSAVLDIPVIGTLDFTPMLKKFIGFVKDIVVTGEGLDKHHCQLMQPDDFLPNSFLKNFRSSVSEAINQVNASVNRFLFDLNGNWPKGTNISVDGNTITLNGPDYTGAEGEQQRFDKALEAIINSSDLGKDAFWLKDEVPTLDEARGKIVLMVRDDSQQHLDDLKNNKDLPELGIELSNKQDNSENWVYSKTTTDGATDLVVSQDKWANPGANEKWGFFKDLAVNAYNGQHPDAIYTNYLSANPGEEPIINYLQDLGNEQKESIALNNVGPQYYANKIPIDGKTGLNAQLDQFIHDRMEAGEYGRYGVMITDFMTEKRAESIYLLNSQLQQDASINLDENVAPIVERTDSNQSTVSFGLQQLIAVATDGSSPLPAAGEQDAAPIMLLTETHGRRAVDGLDARDVFDGHWADSEGQSLGRMQVAPDALAAGSYTPVAVDDDGNSLELTGMTFFGNSVVAEFLGGVEATYFLGGTGTKDQTVESGEHLLTIKRLGALNNGLGFYEAADDGSIVTDHGVFYPDDPGYLQEALRLAEDTVLLHAGDLPDYGDSRTYHDLGLQMSKNYGMLLLHNDDPHDLSSSYARANPNDAVQMTTLSESGDIAVIGIEDVRQDHGTDSDFNDLIVIVGNSPASDPFM